MIVTCEKQVPFRWIAFAILPWASFASTSGAVGSIFIFSLKKFVENPAGVTFILSLPSFVSLVLQPVCSFMSDRIWTRFGRRKPFVAVAFSGVALCLVLMPLMPNFWMLLGTFMLYNACADLNSPMEPLKLEIVPPHERGRATGAMAWCSNLATMTFWVVALGRFDDVTYLDGFPLRGEMAIYWSLGLLLVVMALLITLGIRELEQKSALRGQRLSLGNFFGGLLDRELWPVYMLVVGASCLNFYSGLGALSNLLYTDQWNYTKQEMGLNVAVGGVINIFAIGLLTLFADRLNRMRAYQTLICLSLAGQVFYYCYVNFVLPDKRPTLVEIIFFGETLSILGILTGMVYTPLVYDYIKRNKMGTFNAGSGVVGKLTTLITLNGVGLFVWGYAILFQPASGEMTRVVVADSNTSQSEMLSKLHAATWTYPADGSPAPSSAIGATSWRADGTISSTGACWEIRLRDYNSQKLAEERDGLTSEDAPILADEKLLLDRIAIRKREGADVSAEQQKWTDDEVRSKGIDAKIATDSAELDRRSKVFHDEVARTLAGLIITEGDEVRSVTYQNALMLDLPVRQRPDPRHLEKMLEDLRRAEPGVIDLRPTKRGDVYVLTVSALPPAGADNAVFARELQEQTEKAVAKVVPGLLTLNQAAVVPRLEPAATLDLTILEDPIPTYVSPITRVVNAVLGLFGDAPDPQRHLRALARGLRLPGQFEHVSVEPGAAPKTLAITAVLPEGVPPATPAGDSTARIGQLLQTQSVSTDAVLQIGALLNRVVDVVPGERITIEHPSLAMSYAPMKYDYMSGYLWMFFMGSLGIAITVAFRHIEARGLVRKRGVEEAEQS